MKKIKFSILALLIVTCASACLHKNIDEAIFASLEREVSHNDWGSYNKEKARIFENIYNENSTDKRFASLLFDYLNTEERCYWIGIYLDETSYTKIKNYDLSVKVLEKGLSLTQHDADKVRFYFILGKKYYYKKKFSEAKSYLVIGNRLSEKYPGTVPTWNDDEEYDEIMKFIRSK
ncbi:hypothetical protein EHQ52_15375 [Leptospira koniambonensis]|uniref:Tetratricopeptide repeat protein n=1 Tax=Leptospira koniambonensis TaxID=2484950 RepID=A0A4R9J581_9LEPT|nr:hypothetical protein [Leptospira koniambonensis]TGL31317.1 hypothetical protein EHQ52_15375 [Leptospira koniambonensis]